MLDRDRDCSLWLKLGKILDSFMSYQYYKSKDCECVYMLKEKNWRPILITFGMKVAEWTYLWKSIVKP